MTINAFAEAFHSAANDDERRFFAYMVIRRYMRTAFWLRGFGEKMYDALALQFDEYFNSTVGQVACESYPLFAKMMRKLFCRKKINKMFFSRIQILRLIFELRNIDYYIIGFLRGVKLKCCHAVGR